MLRQTAFRAARPLTTAVRQTSNTRLFHATTPNRVVHNVTTAEDFKRALDEQAKVVVDCFATWCGPCKAIAPILEKASEEQDIKDKVYFVKFDVDELPDLSRELGIRAMPTFFFYKGGEKVDEMVGANPPQLLQKVKNLADD